MDLLRQMLNRSSPGQDSCGRSGRCRRGNHCQGLGEFSTPRAFNPIDALIGANYAPPEVREMTARQIARALYVGTGSGGTACTGHRPSPERASASSKNSDATSASAEKLPKGSLDLHCFVRFPNEAPSGWEIAFPHRGLSGSHDQGDRRPAIADNVRQPNAIH
jgi:hypothetical protein